MRVSIIVNNYNYARFLSEAIESALTQTHPDVEVVVVDDGSTDESRAIIAAYGGRVVPVLKENGGQASAFNAGFAASSGAWVIFLDADDRLAPTAAAEVARHDRPGVAKIQYRLQMIDAAGRPLPALVPPVPHTLPQGDVKGDILTRGGYTCPPTSGNAFRREVLERILPMPAEAWRLAADSYTFLLAPFHGAVASIDAPLGDYRFHGGNHWLHDRLELPAVARQVAYDMQKEALIGEAAAAQGLTPLSALALRNQVHATLRVALRLLAPERSPFPGERVWRLCLHGLRASWKDPQKRPHGRLLLVAWWLVLPVLPAALARRWVMWKLYPGSRPAVLRKRRFGTVATAAPAGRAAT